MSGLTGKRILITGASSGLGAACGAALAEAGAVIVAAGRHPRELEALYPAPHIAAGCDVAREEEQKALAARLKELGIQLDGVVLAAGMQPVKPLMMESHASLSECWGVNVYGSLGLLGALLKSRLLARGASIVLFSSAAATAGGAALASYAASKGALESAARSLAMELAPQGMRVNAVAAGVVETPMSSRYLSRMTADQVAQLKAQHPLGIGTPADIAGPVCFLLSDQARWVTGSVLRADGGLTCH